IGRSVSIDGLPTAVVGVMPASFAFPNSRVEMWVPSHAARADASYLFQLAGVARLRRGVSVVTARAELTGLIADLARVSPNQRGIISPAQPLKDFMVTRWRAR